MSKQAKVIGVTSQRVTIERADGTTADATWIDMRAAAAPFDAYDSRHASARDIITQATYAALLSDAREMAAAQWLMLTETFEDVGTITHDPDHAALAMQARGVV